MQRLANKSAIITGGASGIGRAIASLFVEEGADVTITDINAVAGSETAMQIGATFFEQDVTQEADWKALIKAVSARSNGLHILVNNAGITGNRNETSPELTTLDGWNAVMAVNAGSVFLGCKYGVPQITQSGGGSIINMSSIAALVATPFLSAYGASKAAVCQFSKSVAIHCAEQANRVRCNTIHPGQIMTPMLENLFEDVGKLAGLSAETMRDEFLKKVPQGVFGIPRDIANMALFLASDESSHVTGQQLVVDGGMQYLS